MSLLNNLREKFKKNTKNDLYNEALSKTRDTFVNKLVGLTKKHNKITDDYFEDLEEVLIGADIGIKVVISFVDQLKKRIKEENITNLDNINEIIVDELFIMYVDNSVLTNKINYSSTNPTVVLFIGVNGVGKTTTIGKLASQQKELGKKVLLIAGDTFRAGAKEQLEEWSKKAGVFYFDGVNENKNSDPASVIYDGLIKSRKEDFDLVLIDTAGRLQNKINLMNELAKINKVIKTIIPDAPHETLLVLDATTGQNGISQAKNFKEITSVTGIVLTKLDGTAKGGIILAIREEVGIPVKYVGLGEKITDLQIFDIEKYIYGLFKEMR